MNDLDNSRLNITLENGDNEKEDDKISISIVGIFKNLKRFLAVWLSLTIIASLLVVILALVTKQDSYKKMSALISFSYSGIEKGLDPKGNEFNINTMKSPQIIEKALAEHNIDTRYLESVRKNISFRSITPKKDAEMLTAYKEIYTEGTNASMTAVKKMLDKTVYPTHYIVYFDYAPVGLSSNDAASLLNSILENYSEYFMEIYEYNKSLGNSLSTLSYEEYDYAEAVDAFDTTLTKLSDYVTKLSASAKTDFRSSETGYSFTDLRDTISTVRTLDLDRISSYITLNTISKDKESLRAYYQYRKESLERHLAVCKDTIATVNASLNNYQQNTIMLFGNDVTDQMSVDPAEANKQYDKLFEQRLSIQDDLSDTVQRINRYEKRIQKLDEPVNSVSIAQMARVEEDLKKLNSKTNELIELVNKTTDDYYKTVVFSKAYNILVPANSSYVNVSKQVMNDASFTIILVDAVIFLLYIAVSVIFSCIEEYARYHSAKSETEPDAETETA